MYCAIVQMAIAIDINPKFGRSIPYGWIIFLKNYDGFSRTPFYQFKMKAVAQAQLISNV